MPETVVIDIPGNPSTGRGQELADMLTGPIGAMVFIEPTRDASRETPWVGTLLHRVIVDWRLEAVVIEPEDADGVTVTVFREHIAAIESHPAQGGA